MSLDITKLSKKDAHEILGVGETAGRDEIHRAYRRMAAACHPDANGSRTLFQLVNNAYMRLSDDGSGVTGGPPRKPARPAKTFDETVSDPAFMCPFKAFLAAIEFGRFGFMFGDRPVELTPDLIDGFFIRTRWPATLEIRTYKNLFGYLLDRPSGTKATRVEFENAAPESRRFSHDITLRGNDTGAKYYRLSINMDLLGTRLESKGRLSELRSGPEEIMTYVMGPFKLLVKCIVRYRP